MSVGARDPVIVGVGLSDAPKAPHLDSIGHHVQAIQRALADCPAEQVRIGMRVEAYAIECGEGLAVPFWRPAPG